MSEGTGTLGRDIVLKWNGVAVAGVREKAVNINGEPVDVSDGNSSGWRELLTKPGEKSVELTLSGIAKSNTLKQVALSDDRIGAVTLEYPNGDILAGDFYLATHNNGQPYKEAETFEATLQSSGAVVFTAV